MLLIIKKIVKNAHGTGIEVLIYGEINKSTYGIMNHLPTNDSGYPGVYTAG